MSTRVYLDGVRRSLYGLALVSCSALAVTPQSGLWIIDAEADGRPGRGIAIDARGNVLVTTVYAYQNSGLAQWYLASGPFDGNSFQGTLATYEGGTPFGAAPVAAHAGATAGTISLSFIDATHGTVTLPGEPTRAISKVVFGSAVPQTHFKLEAWADNWFAAFHGDILIGEDHIPITTERSFNSETFLFDASYPLELNFVLKDYKQNDSGLEYIGAANQQIGDGGFIMQLTDTTTGAVVAVSGSDMRCLVIHTAPLNPSCERDVDPSATCQSQILPEPAGWKLPDYDLSGWTQARTYTEAEIGVKEGYFDIHWDARARLQWSADLRLDNTLLCKLRLTAPPELAASTFSGNLVLGAPTAHSIHANVYAPTQAGSVALVVGTAPGAYQQRTPTTTLEAGRPLDISIGGLQANTRYWYRLEYRSADGASAGYGPESSFTTARAPGSSYTFIVQGDSHPERARAQFDATLYQRTLLTAAADQPDFMLMLGDDFSVDTIAPTLINQALVTERYALQRPWLGLIGRSAPIFLVNGNHEQAARYLYDGTPNNIAVWAQTARNQYYTQPAPDEFYSGNPEQLAHIGYLRNYYAWTWGDALFVVLDPYWGSAICVDEPYGGGTKRSNLWDITHGEAQYRWLQSTLAQSTARHKFVFAHHVLGTGRGGTDVATRFEWGGLNNNGASSGFASNRPGWEAPIHQLMAEHGVTIFFQGHDHIFVRQELDGVTYQSMPEPADPNYSLFNADAYATGDKFPNSGYARVRVSPDGVQVDYVRTWLPADEGPGRVSGSTAFSYSLP